MKFKLISLLLTSSVIMAAPGVNADDNRFTYCEFGEASDSDGDGYGWENNATCLVKSAVSYTITVRNLTLAQILSPVIAVSHDDSVALLHAGHAASTGMTAIAEGGDTSVLEASLATNTSVDGVSTSGGPVPPATEVSFELRAAMPYISVTAMLVNTNDAVMLIDTAELPDVSGDYVKYYAHTWDAGTETNDESCAHIPGPACGGVGASANDDGEGFVHIHRGLQGNGDLDAALHAWNDPVAVVTIERH